MEMRKFSSYAEYVETQTRVNLRKLSSVWVTPADVEAIAAAIRKYVPGARAGICHGVRNGWEVHALRDRLGIDVVGTEISGTAARFEYVIQWDFHEPRTTWRERFDFVYSNSLDHSYDPEKCLNSWSLSLRPGGLFILHWGHGHTGAQTPADCFSATKAEYLELMRPRFRFLEEIVVPRIDQTTKKPGRTYLLVANVRLSEAFEPALT
jgi:SAM-dependent methyltransferase